VALAYLVGRGTGLSFWLSLSATSLAYHFFGRVLPAISPGWRLASSKGPSVPEVAGALEEEDAPVGDAASTIA
jgi:hypothetical protein